MIIRGALIEGRHAHWKAFGVVMLNNGRLQICLLHSNLGHQCTGVKGVGRRNAEPLHARSCLQTELYIHCCSALNEGHRVTVHHICRHLRENLKPAAPGDWSQKVYSVQCSTILDCSGETSHHEPERKHDHHLLLLTPLSLLKKKRLRLSASI